MTTLSWIWGDITKVGFDHISHKAVIGKCDSMWGNVIDHAIYIWWTKIY